jgi:hypothetical protein
MPGREERQFPIHTRNHRAAALGVHAQPSFGPVRISARAPLLSSPFNGCTHPGGSGSRWRLWTHVDPRHSRACVVGPVHDTTRHTGTRVPITFPEQVHLPDVEC